MVLHAVSCAFGGLYQWSVFFFFQAEDGIRDLVRSRGLGDVYKRQGQGRGAGRQGGGQPDLETRRANRHRQDRKGTARGLSLIHI